MKTWQKIKVNPEILPQYLVHEKVVDVIRAFFKRQKFHEVSTPILVPVPSAESNLEVFQTELKTSTGAKREGFLIMSPEYSIKKLLSAGVGSCFEITKCFRNEEEVSRLHNHEFTMLEWYRVGATYKNVMNDFENLFTEIIKQISPDVNLKEWDYLGEKFDLSLPWPRITVAQAFEKFAGIDKETMLDKEKLAMACQAKGYKLDDQTTWEQMFYQVFFNDIEPALKKSHKPFFVHDYPLSQAALSKKCDDDPRFAQRFEVFLAGVELGNCFSELTDATEQSARFDDDLQERKRLGKTPYGKDEDFLEALKSGMPEVSGIAVGVDRLVMLAANVESVAETIFFPASEIFDLQVT